MTEGKRHESERSLIASLHVASSGSLHTFRSLLRQVTSELSSASLQRLCEQIVPKTQRLPDALWQHIWSWLDFHESWWLVERVCRRWRQLSVQGGWHRISLQGHHVYSEAHLQWLQSRMRHGRSLRVNFCTQTAAQIDTTLQWFSERCKHMVEWQISNHSDVNICWFRTATHLLALRLYAPDIYWQGVCLAHFESLRELRRLEMDTTLNTQRLRLLSPLTSLEVLSFRNWNQLQPDDVADWSPFKRLRCFFAVNLSWLSCKWLTSLTRLEEFACETIGADVTALVVLKRLNLLRFRNGCITVAEAQLLLTQLPCLDDVEMAIDDPCHHKDRQTTIVTSLPVVSTRVPKHVWIHVKPDQRQIRPDWERSWRPHLAQLTNSLLIHTQHLTLHRPPRQNQLCYWRRFARLEDLSIDPGSSSECVWPESYTNEMWSRLAECKLLERVDIAHIEFTCSKLSSALVSTTTINQLVSLSRFRMLLLRHCKIKNPVAWVETWCQTQYAKPRLEKPELHFFQCSGVECKAETPYVVVTSTNYPRLVPSATNA